MSYIYFKLSIPSMKVLINPQFLTQSIKLVLTRLVLNIFCRKYFSNTLTKLKINISFNFLFKIKSTNSIEKFLHKGKKIVFS